MSDFYTVVKGDTLGKIAKATGTTTSDLMKLNQIDDPRHLQIGQRLALRKEVVTGIQLLFLDWSRDPIAGLEYIVEYAGKVIKGVTPANGLGRKIFTDAATDEVRIFVKRLDGTLKEIGSVVSGYGNKLVTLLSPSVKVDGATEKHPELKPGEHPNPKEPVKPTFDPKAKQVPTHGKEDFGLKPKPTTTPDGKPLTPVTGDIPDLSFLDEYNGEVMTEEDYEWAAKELDVEKAAIKAFAIVESGGGKAAGFVKLGKRLVPAILYERHKFSTGTGHRFSAKYPDISLPCAYYNKKAIYVVADCDYKKSRGIPEDVQYYRPLNKSDSQKTRDGAVNLENMLESGRATAEKDTYVNGIANYKRLGKAYQLEKNVALESCSWGAFQIMGEYWKPMKYASVHEFVKAVSRSPKEQVRSFVLYMKYVNPRIKGYLKDKDWAAVAKAYNGPNYQDNNYDKRFSKAYDEIKRNDR